MRELLRYTGRRCDVLMKTVRWVMQRSKSSLLQYHCGDLWALLRKQKPHLDLSRILLPNRNDKSRGRGRRSWKIRDDERAREQEKSSAWSDVVRSCLPCIAINTPNRTQRLPVFLHRDVKMTWLRHHLLIPSQIGYKSNGRFSIALPGIRPWDTEFFRPMDSSRYRGVVMVISLSMLQYMGYKQASCL